MTDQIAHVENDMSNQIVRAENDIKELSSLRKFDGYIKLADFHHVERCGNIDCSNCLFIINLK